VKCLAIADFTYHCVVLYRACICWLLYVCVLVLLGMYLIVDTYSNFKLLCFTGFVNIRSLVQMKMCLTSCRRAAATICPRPGLQPKRAAAALSQAGRAGPDQPIRVIQRRTLRRGRCGPAAAHPLRLRRPARLASISCGLHEY